MSDNGFWKPAPIDVWKEEARNEEDVSVTSLWRPSNVPIMQQRMLLPIYRHRRQILYAVEKYHVVVIVGETGSGTPLQPGGIVAILRKGLHLLLHSVLYSMLTPNLFLAPLFFV